MIEYCIKILGAQYAANPDYKFGDPETPEMSAQRNRPYCAHFKCRDKDLTMTKVYYDDVRMNGQEFVAR